jgi:hypothetical protein
MRAYSPGSGHARPMYWIRCCMMKRVRRAVNSFEQQFHFGIFHSYLTLREQEIRNIMWISRMCCSRAKAKDFDGIVFTI